MLDQKRNEATWVPLALLIPQLVCLQNEICNNAFILPQLPLTLLHLFKSGTTRTAKLSRGCKWQLCFVQSIPVVEFREFLTRWLVQCLRAEENCWQQLAAWSLLLKCDARCRAVEFLFACHTPLFLIEFVFARNLFATAWSWYGHFSKSLFSLNLWQVVYQLAVLYRHLSVNVSPQGSTTISLDWLQVFGGTTFWVLGLYRTLS